MTGSGGEFLECFRLSALYFRVLGYRVSRFWVWGLVVDDRRIWGCYRFLNQDSTAPASVGALEGLVGLRNVYGGFGASQGGGL